MSSLINLDQAIEYLLKLAPQAGDILRKYFHSGQITAKLKDQVDVLTQADSEVEDFLTKNLKLKFPQFPILGEETAPKDYQSFKNLDNLWVIDPLDGTLNFSRGIDNFAVSIGLVNKGIPKLGVVYVPIAEQLYWTHQREDKVFLNGKPIKVSSVSRTEECLIGSGLGWDLQTRPKGIHWLENLSPYTRQIAFYGSAVADMARVASGKIDAYINTGLKPWDTAAAALFIEKAGGKVTTPTGEKWDVFQPEMIASNGVLHSKILKLINK